MIPFALPDVGDAEAEAVGACLRSGWLTSGKMVQKFEKDFAAYVEAGYAIAVNSATMGAMLILDALGVGPGDEVIVPAYTFSGPAMMAHRLGANVVFADCLPDSFQVDPEDVFSKLTRRTKVVMPTHFAGAPCHTALLKEMCDAIGCALVDDAAHAFPTQYDGGDHVGRGDRTTATFFSFYATKCLTTGEGGMITTNDAELAQRIRHLRLHGFDRAMYDRYTNPGTGWRYDIAHPGWKANMTDLSASLGLVQLRRGGEMWLKRRQIAERYLKAFAGNNELTLPQDDPGHAWHLFPMRVEGRDSFVEEMAKRGVQCSVHFIPLHLHSYWQEVTGVEPGMLPNAERLFAEEVSLPIFSSMTDEQVQTVIDTVLDVLWAR